MLNIKSIIYITKKIETLLYFTIKCVLSNNYSLPLPLMNMQKWWYITKNKYKKLKTNIDNNLKNFIVDNKLAGHQLDIIIRKRKKR